MIKNFQISIIIAIFNRKDELFELLSSHLARMDKIYIKLVLIFFLISPLKFLSQEKNFFNKGKVEINNSVEKIPLNFINDIAIVKVEINGKFYNFLFDTGAPLVISNKIFDELNLKTTTESAFKDTHNEIRKQKFAYLPLLKSGNVSFKNFGAVVVDFEDPLFKCYGIEGILGANQMAKLYWKVDYQNNDLEVTKDLKNFHLQDYKYKIRFTPMPQKSPRINIRMLGEIKELLFDTGYAGNIGVNKSQINIDNQKISNNLISKFGLGAIGMYGVGKKTENYIFKVDDFSFGNIPNSKQIIETSETSIIGNVFLKNYIFILDWKKNEILLKETQNIPIDYEALGFSYRISEGKAKVAYVYQNQNIPLLLDDEILTINNEKVEGLSDEEACQFYYKSKKENKNQLILKIKRGNEILEFNIKKH